MKNELLKSSKCARQRYEIHLEEQKKSTKEKKKNEELVEKNNYLQTITAQCSTLEDSVKELDASFVNMMKKNRRKEHCTLSLKGMH